MSLGTIAHTIKWIANPRKLVIGLSNPLNHLMISDSNLRNQKNHFLWHNKMFNLNGLAGFSSK